MGFDFRYPNMFRVDSAPGLDFNARRAASSVADRICKRVDGLKCSFNSRTGGLFFHYTNEPDSGPTEIPFVKGDSFHRYDGHEIDNVVRYIQLGRMSRRDKDRIAANQKQRDNWDAQDNRNKHKADVRPSALDYASFLDKKRRGTTKTVVA